MNRQGLLKISPKEKSADKDINKAKVRAINEAKKVVEIDYLRRADELIVLQHVIRRFKLHHETDFNELLQTRREIEEILLEDLPGGMKSESWSSLYIDLLSYLLELLDDHENLQRLNENGPAWAYSTIGPGIDAIRNRHLEECSLSGLPFDDLDLVRLVEVMQRCGSKISDIKRRVNYLDFYSLLGITSHIPAEKFYIHYIQAKDGHHQPKPYVKALVIDDEALWMVTKESAIDKDFSVLLQDFCVRPRRISKNIDIFGGSQHSVSINNIPLENRLILSIPTNETPDRIDDAVREFRAALRQELILNCGGYFNVDTPEFSQSIFMRQFSHHPCLVKDWDQLQRQIIGLWAWDISVQENQTVDFACKEVVKKMEGIKLKLGHKLPIYYEVNTVRRYYEYAVKEIFSRKPKMSLTPVSIDRFVTRSDCILGTKGLDSNGQ